MYCGLLIGPFQVCLRAARGTDECHVPASEANRCANSGLVGDPAAWALLVRLAMPQALSIDSLATLLRVPLPVFVNAQAGSAGADAEREIATALEKAGVPALVQLAEPEALMAGLREAVRAGAPAVGVAGGDGTLSGAVSVVLGSNTVLVPFPMGTLNHFARRLGMDTIQTAADSVANGCIVAMPVGTVNGRVFINNASCGFYPNMVRHRDQLQPFVSKWPAAVIASLMMLAKRPRMDVEVDVQGFRISRTTAAVWVGLGRDSARLPENETGPRTARTLEIVIPRDLGRVGLVLLAIRVSRLLRAGRPMYQAKGLETLHARSFTLDSKYPLGVARDGEAMLLDPPVSFALHESALRVVCARLTP
jgi:diacylglycerol kinase family enzyme